MSNPHSDYRSLERLVFGGVPEKPEPTYQVNVQADANGRFSMRPNSPTQDTMEQPENEPHVLAVINYYPDKQLIEVERS